VDAQPPKKLPVLRVSKQAQKSACFKRQFAQMGHTAIHGRNEPNLTNATDQLDGLLIFTKTYF
jgi:hypothetical protein